MPDTPALARLVLVLSSAGRLHLEPAADAVGIPDALTPAVAARIRAAFALGAGNGLLHLGAREVGTTLPPEFAYFRDFAGLLIARLCALPELEEHREQVEVAPPALPELEALAASVPPMPGAEYLTADVLAALWSDALAAFRDEIAGSAGSVQDHLSAQNPIWNLVGRVHLHLAERKDEPARPFAFLATYTTRVGAGSREQHRPLGQAVAQSAEAKDKSALVALLKPLQRAAERSPYIKELLDRGDLFHPLAWTPDEAYRFLQSQPECEAAGVVVRVPDWWRARRSTGPRVTVSLGSTQPSTVGLDALLQFDVTVTLGGRTLTDAELRELKTGADGLVRLRGQWVEIDREQLDEVLTHWRSVRRLAGRDGISFIDGMRLLAGTPIDQSTESAAPDVPRWSQVRAGPWLEQALATLRSPEALPTDERTLGLAATLRPYQKTGVAWLRLLTKLELGACLADDMGLGKTIQVLALLLERRGGRTGPSLLVAPASLLANWQAEIDRFAPGLLTFIAHPSATPVDVLATMSAVDVRPDQLVITTYGTTLRLAWLADVEWNLVVLDEAQAIKNAGAKQTKAVKRLRARSRIALTGTPIENRLGDLWSLFDFLNPGLLGTAPEFARFVKRLTKADPPDFAPLRRLVSPYVLRRMKTDRRIIADLPDKTEMKAYCNLTPLQATLYQQAVDALAAKLDRVEGIERRGAVLAFLMRFKQICNHPSQWLGDGTFDPAASGKVARLAEICESIGARQEKVLVFTQFREMTEPLERWLASTFGRRGLVLHGAIPVRERKALVDRFQNDDGVPYFVLSVKAGGTGLNLTAAAHVIHFDRWWNPAVEDQATDRAFRIGQTKNVMVHKFVCRGTVEEKIDVMIASKKGVAGEVLDADGRILTELTDAQLLDFVALDLRRATAEL